MSWTEDGIGDFFTLTSASVTTYPFTLGCIFQAANATTSQGVMGVDDGTGTNDFSLEGNGTATSWRFRANDGTGANAATSTLTVVANTWYLFNGVGTNATSRACLIDGANKGTTITSKNPTGIANTRVGDSAAKAELNGKIAAAYILDIAAADADILAQVVTAGSIYKSPLLIPAWYGHVIRYWRLDSTGALTEILDRNTLTLNGNPVVGVNGLQIIEPTSHQTQRGMRRAYMRGSQ